MKKKGTRERKKGRREGEREGGGISEGSRRERERVVV